MSPLYSRSIRLAPVAFALALAIGVPAAARAQAPPAASGTSASAVKDIPLGATDRQRYVGTYLLSQPGSTGMVMPLRVYEEKGALYGQPQSGSAKRLLYQGDHAFRVEREPDAAVSFLVENDRATIFRVDTPQGLLEGKRVEEKL